jgi:hypothetical protein
MRTFISPPFNFILIVSSIKIKIYMEELKMSKEITMTIHQFMEMERGNINIEDIPNKHSYRKYFSPILTVLFLVFMFANTSPAIQSAPQQVNTELLEDVSKALYITAVVGLEIMYEAVMGIASLTI